MPFTWEHTYCGPGQQARPTLCHREGTQLKVHSSHSQHSLFQGQSNKAGIRAIVTPICSTSHPGAFSMSKTWAHPPPTILWPWSYMLSPKGQFIFSSCSLCWDRDEQVVNGQREIRAPRSGQQGKIWPAVVPSHFPSSALDQQRAAYLPLF